MPSVWTVAFLGAGAHPLGRMAAWSAAELGGLRHAATHTFAFIFGGLMVFDLVLLKVEPLILLHHVLCLGGLLYASLQAPSLYPYFLAGVMLLELGSGVCNFYWCEPTRPARRHLYGAIMSLSNVGALCCAGAHPQPFCSPAFALC